MKKRLVFKNSKLIAVGICTTMLMTNAAAAEAVAPMVVFESGNIAVAADVNANFDNLVLGTENNVTDILNNTGLIGGNGSNIEKNELNIVTNDTDIDANESGIKINAGLINSLGSTNSAQTSWIGNNSNLIEENKDIASNALSSAVSAQAERQVGIDQSQTDATVKAASDAAEAASAALSLAVSAQANLQVSIDQTQTEATAKAASDAAVAASAALSLAVSAQAERQVSIDQTQTDATAKVASDAAVAASAAAEAASAALSSAVSAQAERQAKIDRTQTDTTLTHSTSLGVQFLLTNQFKTDITNLTTGVTSNQNGLSGSNVEIGLLQKAAAQSGTEDPSDSSPVGSIYVNTTNQSVHVVVGTAPDTTWKQVTEMTYTVGDMGPGGGVVIDITTDGLHGIEAVKLDSTIVFDSTPDYAGCATELITFAKAGFGERNSMALLYDGCSTLSADAVMSAVSFTGNGYTDWALATSAEVEYALNCSTGYCSAKFGLEKAEYWSSTVREGEPNLSVEVVFGSDSAVHSKMWNADLDSFRSVISTRRF